MQHSPMGSANNHPSPKWADTSGIEQNAVVRVSHTELLNQKIDHLQSSVNEYKELCKRQTNQIQEFKAREMATSNVETDQLAEVRRLRSQVRGLAMAVTAMAREYGDDGR